MINRIFASTLPFNPCVGGRVPPAATKIMLFGEPIVRLRVNGVEQIEEIGMTDESQAGTSSGGDGAGYLAYETPDDILRDKTLDKEEKRKLLESWKMDIDGRLDAESEGMSSSHPMAASKEASLADQEQLVGEALEMLDKDEQE